MRVVVTVPNWTLNGVNTFSASLVRLLCRAGVEANILVTGSVWRDNKPLPLPDDLPIKRLTLPAVPTWGARREALRCYLERRAPCIYLPNHDVMHSGISPALSSCIGIIGIAHSDDPQHYKHARRLGRWWNAAIGVSVRIADELRTFSELAGVRIDYLPYGVAVTDREPLVRSTDGPGRSLSILYAGRLELRQKRVDDLVAIAGRLRELDVPFVMNVVGEGPARGMLEARVRALALEGHVRFAGTRAPDAMSDTYRAHDVFVLPSAYEGLPLALLEAMGERCIPVVTAIASGVPELVHDHEDGRVVPVGDIEAFASALAALQRNPMLRARMANTARERIRRGGYDSATMAARYRELLSDVWTDVASGRYRRVSAPVLPPPELSVGMRLRAPIAGWRDHLLQGG